MLGCPLDQAFSNDLNNNGTTIVKKKKKKDKDKSKVIYEDDLEKIKPVNDFSNVENDFSSIKQELQGSKSISPYEYDFDSYYPIQQQHQQQQHQQHQQHQQQQHQQNNQQQHQQQHIKQIKEKDSEQENFIKISNEEYKKYKAYQQEIYNKNQIVEGFNRFDSINDNFNDIILFALTGIFFIIFTDYIYKLGKKSY